MIRINRGTEPQGLKRAAPKRLKAAAEAFNQYGAPSKDLSGKLTGYGTPEIKRALFDAQKGKCAWCERHTDFSSAPVEHYRPKDGAWRHRRGETKRVDSGHYWWLAWTWSNLLFSCARCNDASHKANYFPLHSGTAPATPPVAPLAIPPPSPIVDVSAEQALLLDPAGSEDPLDHITWLPGNTSYDRSEWIWTPSGLTEEGRETIAILKLDELAGRAQGHVRYQLLPSIEEVEQHLADRRPQAAHKRWNRFLKDNLSTSAAWTAFTWCALDHLVPRQYRQQHQLAEPTRPGAR